MCTENANVPRPEQLEGQMSIAQGIQQIIDQRKGLGEYQGKGHLAKIERCQNFFIHLREKVQEYEDFRQNLIAQEAAQAGDYYSHFKEDPTLIDRVNDASANNVLVKLEQCIDECKRLYTRFNRDTVNISVIGLARQGKSCLLQSISGLENSVIPTSNGGDCTGTTSIICNEPGTVSARAEVVFFSDKEILNTVRKYIESIGLDHAVGSFNGIPSLQAMVDQYDEGKLPKFTAKQKALFLHLRKYIEHFDEYSQLVREGVRPATESEIRQYVAQHDEQQHATYQYLAVKEVRIYKEFHFSEAGRIQLVDTIGVGDTSLGIEEKMLNTLRNNSDASFWLKLPARTGDHWGEDEVTLYDKIAGTMGTEMLDKWLYIVLNSSPSLGNEVSTQAVLDDINRYRLHKAGVVVADCMNKEQVQEQLILPSLQYLAANLNDVDNDLMKKANELFKECYYAYDTLYHRANDILSNTAQAKVALDNFAIEKWDDIKKVISSAIGKVYIDYKDNKDNALSGIIKEVKKLRSYIYNYVPKKEWYIDRLTAMDINASPERVYSDGLHIVRTSISSSFETISYTEVGPLQEELKKRVAKVLYDEGRWNEFFPGETASLDWLKDLAQEKLNEYPQLRSALEFLLTYQINISNLLDYEVEECLGILDDQSRQFEPLDIAEMRRLNADLSFESKATFIKTATINKLETVEKKLVNADFKFIKVPSHALYACVRKFREKFVMTEKTQKELRKFYLSNARSIWAEEYRELVLRGTGLDALSSWIQRLPQDGTSMQNYKLTIQQSSN